LSQDRLGIVTFATAGFLIASILIFGLVAMPELLPAAYPQLRHGTVGIRAISTSGQIIGPPVSSIEITVNLIRLHRVGVGEGTWITMLKQPVRLSPIEMAGKPVNLDEVTVPMGDYNLMGLSFGNVTAIVREMNVTLKAPTQEFKTPLALTVREAKRSNLVIDLSFNEPAVMISKSFDPYITVTVEQPGRAPLSTIASLKPITSIGPDALDPNQTKSYTFTVEPGGVVDNYLVHVEAVPSVENTFDLEIVETGEFWYDLTGNLWFLGGNLTSGTYHANVQASPGTTAPVTFAVSLYSVPRIAGDLPDAAFSGFIPAGSPQSIRVNEFGLYFDNPGMYDFYPGVKAGDYEFLIDNNPTAVVNNDQMVTLQLGSGLHTFQVFADFSGSGRETSWSVGVVPATGASSQPLSREAMLSTGLLVVAAFVFVVDVSVRYVRRKRLDEKLARSVQTS
jgi:hypothetical protein